MKTRLSGAAGVATAMILAAAAPAYAFPTRTDVADSFNRTGTASLGANWAASNVPGATGTVALGNQRVQFPSSSWSSAHWATTQFGGLQEATVQKTSPGQVGVTACLTNPGPNASGFALTTESTGSLTLKRYANGVATTLFSNDSSGGTVATGNAVGIAVTSTGVQAWIGNGTWTLAKTVSDASAPSCSGRIGVIGLGASGDNFSGGGLPYGGTPPGAMQTVAPQAASRFVSSVGINTHFRYPDSGSPYCTKFSTAVARLKSLGIDDVRDELLGYPTDPASSCNVISKYETLVGEGFGINLLANVMDQDNRDVATAMNRFSNATSGTDDVLDVATRINARAKPAGMPGAGLTSIEGPNEYDRKGDGDWIAKISTLTPQLYNASKARLASTPVLFSSFAKGGQYTSSQNSYELYDASGTSTLFDINNMHFYSNRFSPEERLDKWLLDSNNISSTTPLVSTETGWNDGTNTLSVSRFAAATYTARSLLLLAKKGVSRTYLYELADMGTDNSKPQHRWGLLKNDLEPKPSFYAVKRLLAALADGDVDGTTTYTPATFGLGIGGTGISSHILGKQNGSYVVALWQSAPITNATTGANLPAAAATSVPLTFSRSFATSTFRPAEPDASTVIKEADYNPSTSWIAGSTGTTATVSVGADPVLLRLVPTP